MDSTPKVEAHLSAMAGVKKDVSPIRASGGKV